MAVIVLKIKVLGKGSYRVVHLVKIITIVYNQIYVIKSTNKEYSSFLRMEKEILLKFVYCPNIIQCYGVFMTIEQGRGKVYNMFIEYALRGSLLDMMNKYTDKSLERDVNYYTQMILKGFKTM
ncbi:hypothetical protein PVK06_036041 [Gossypium arboreum]|uniref:Protein kinase domain-containing protein n=1 Tax=Gossypium arboreum TaxID=29729 RepID=A0ABR0NKL0_GOSAR|nr:hypothetical protein PVK06_036041 [Gossypium arboreum]